MGRCPLFLRLTTCLWLSRSWPMCVRVPTMLVINRVTGQPCPSVQSDCWFAVLGCIVVGTAPTSLSSGCAHCWCCSVSVPQPRITPALSWECHGSADCCCFVQPFCLWTRNKFDGMSCAFACAAAGLMFLGLSGTLLCIFPAARLLSSVQLSAVHVTWSQYGVGTQSNSENACTASLDCDCQRVLALPSWCFIGPGRSSQVHPVCEACLSCYACPALPAGT